MNILIDEDILCIAVIGALECKAAAAAKVIEKVCEMMPHLGNGTIRFLRRELAAYMNKSRNKPRVLRSEEYRMWMGLRQLVLEEVKRRENEVK